MDDSSRKYEASKNASYTVNATSEILDQIRPLSELYDYIFPGERDTNSHVSLFTANAAIKRSLELVTHGLRSVASTALHERDFDSLLIEACLSHADQK